MFDPTRSKPDHLTAVMLPLATYCAGCQTLMNVGTPVLKEDGATFWHAQPCPNTHMRHFAAHKHPNTEMDISPR